MNRVQIINVHSESTNFVVTSLVIRIFVGSLGALRICAMFAIPIWGFGKQIALPFSEFKRVS